MNDNNQSQDTRQMTFGEKLVGKKFNPSNDSSVDKLKSLFAEAADIVRSEFQDREHSEVSRLIYDQAMGEILNAQMNSVKAVTLKY